MSVDAFIEAQRRMLSRYCVTAESRFVDVSSIGGRAQVLVSGKGPPVVMMNGIGTPAAMWAPLMARLEGFTIYGVDLPGFGLTDATPHLTDDYRPNAARFIEQVLDELRLDRPVFVANSLGSLWTTWLALDKPERLAAMVHVGAPALILGTSAPLPMRLLSVARLGRLMMKVQPPSPGQVEQLAKMVKEHPLVPELAELLLQTEQLAGFEPTFLATVHRLIRVRGARPEMAMTVEQLSRIAQPVQFFWGADDPFGTPAVGRRAADIMPQAELHVVSGGHAPWLREAERIGELTVPFIHAHSVTSQP